MREELDDLQVRDYRPFCNTLKLPIKYSEMVTIDNSLIITIFWLWQIFLSTRWAILLNLHVEMFRVNKYPK